MPQIVRERATDIPARRIRLRPPRQVVATHDTVVVDQFRRDGPAVEMFVGAGDVEVDVKRLAEVLAGPLEELVRAFVGQGVAEGADRCSGTVEGADVVGQGIQTAPTPDRTELGFGQKAEIGHLDAIRVVSGLVATVTNPKEIPLVAIG